MQAVNYLSVKMNYADSVMAVCPAITAHDSLDLKQEIQIQIQIQRCRALYAMYFTPVCCNRLAGMFA
jgi:hypothetical protein